jgi:hypothetical protein
MDEKRHQIIGFESFKWGCTTGNAAPVAPTTFYVLKENNAEKIP